MMSFASSVLGFKSYLTMDRRSNLRAPAEAKARVLCDGTAEAVPYPKPIYEAASQRLVLA